MDWGVSEFESELVDAVGTGWVRPRSARLWVRSSKGGRLRVILRDQQDRTITGEGTFEPVRSPELDGSASFRWPEDVEGARELLRPGSNYSYEIVRERDDVRLGHGEIATPPEGDDDCPEKFAIAVASCHQPFEDDGTISKKASRLVDKAHEVLDAHHVKAVVLCGDQMYTDYPQTKSLFEDEFFAKVGPRGRSSMLECSREEVRSLLHARYRAFWGMNEFQRLQADWACYPMLDDHEIVDNFGSAPAHDTDEWRAIRAGALDACHDYQTSRVLGRHGSRPDSLHYGFRWGPVGCFVMDLRSEKRATEDECSIYSTQQLEDLARFLRGNEDAGLLMVTLSVPLAHIPEWMSAAGKVFEGEGGDLADRWGQPAARRSRDQVMALLYEHRQRRPWQPLVLLGGDVHMGAVSELRWKDDSAASMYQLISSPLTNDETPVVKLGSALAHEMLQEIEGPEGVPAAQVRLLPGSAGLNRNPLPALNMGIVEVTRREGRTFFKLMQLALGDDDEPHIVYESAELPGPMGGGPAARGDYLTK
ncbi:MAG: hypothetical protein CMN30_21770 [Sandaracinus sp.]|nr:hypothetical protein [Sandaracinus sp.]|tara:strand:- start:2384 stop:3985 length:1602 start_codon:yes stop_codon:yes gene_type:complete